MNGKTKSYKSDDVEDAFRAYLGEIEIDLGILKPIEGILREYLRDEDKQQIQEKRRLNKQLKILEKRKQRITDLRISDDIDSATC